MRALRAPRVPSISHGTVLRVIITFELRVSRDNGPSAFVYGAVPVGSLGCTYMQVASLVLCLRRSALSLANPGRGTSPKEIKQLT